MSISSTRPITESQLSLVRFPASSQIIRNYLNNCPVLAMILFVVRVGLVRNVYPHSVSLTKFTHRFIVAFDDEFYARFGLNKCSGRHPRKTKFA